MKNIIDQINGLYEYEYFSLIVDHIYVENDLDVVFMKWDQTIPETKNKCILFVTSDEHHQYLEKFTDHPKVLLTFRNYLPEIEHPKVKALPLGYLQGFKSKDIPINERKYDYSFLGNLSHLRHNFRAGVDEQTALQRFILFYDGWNNGLETEDYSDVMNDTKIALCPKGFFSSETFRYFEAAKAGCVIISEPQPDVWFYRNAPHIEVKNSEWVGIHSIVDSIMNSKNALEYYHQETKDWWENTASPRAVGEYVTEELRSVGFV